MSEDTKNLIQLLLGVDEVQLAGGSFTAEIFILRQVKQQIETFGIQEHDLRMLKATNSMLRSKNFECEHFNILRPCPWMVKTLIQMFLTSQTSKLRLSQIEAFRTQGHDPRVLKRPISRSQDLKTSNSKLLTSWGPCLHGRSFNLDVFGLPIFQTWGSSEIETKLLSSSQPDR